MARNKLRSLIWLPIIHTEVDQGSLSESIRRAYIRKLGKWKWAQHLEAIERTWQQISDFIDALETDFASMRIYQDGLPVCGRETSIVQELAQAGSRNHILLMRLIEKGAHLMGTESPELLVEEYQLAQRGLESLESGQDGDVTEGQRERSRRLLQRRDRFIAERIDQTLQRGETGLLFLGRLHALDGLLPDDIAIRRPELALRGEA